MPVHPDPALTARVLDAARSLNARGAGWSMAELARAAGVARATLRRRFARREDVLAALAHAGDPRPTIRDRALDAFLAVARRKGLASATLEDVAAEAGLGVATIYRHFGGREGLLDAYANERTPRARLSLLDPAAGRPPADVLRAVAQAMIEHLVAEGPLLLLGLSPDPEARRMLARLRELEAQSRAELRAWFERALARGQLRGEPTALTNGFVGMVAGAALLAEPGEIDPARLAGQLVELFLRGCEAPVRAMTRKTGAR